MFIIGIPVKILIYIVKNIIDNNGNVIKPDSIHKQDISIK